MIRLFRKIRHRLLSEDKYSIYILYATGEIILVVVGILLALQIDNWNENRKERMEEVKLLQSIHLEFTENQLLLDVKIQEHQMIAKAARQMVNLCDPNPVEISMESLNKLMGYILWVPQYMPNLGAVNSIISSGKTALLKNDLTPHVLKHYPIRNIEIDLTLEMGSKSGFTANLQALLSSIEFENTLVLRRLDSDLLLERAISIRECQAEIMELIDVELIEYLDIK